MQFKALVVLLICLMSDNAQASTSTEKKFPSNTKKNTNKTAEIVIPGLVGLGTGALTMWAEQKSNLAHRYLQWRGGATDYWSESKAIGEGLFYYGIGVPALTLGTSALAFWAAHKAYQSKRASSLRERFWNWWYNRKPKIKESTIKKPTIN